MILTNKYNLPEPLVKATSWGMKPRTGLSVTDLIQPPKITQLTRRHWDEITVDASERIWVLLGQAIHYILSIYYADGAVQEETLSLEVDGVKITGRPDLWIARTLDDYKVTSAWSVVFEPQGREDWHKQLNVYNWMNYKATGRESDLLRDILILRDWQNSKANDQDYPPIPVAVVEVPAWPHDKTEQYVKERIRLHLEAQGLPDGQLPSCSEDEMWAKPTTYAVMKEGRKSAVRVFDTYEDALIFADELMYIQERPGRRVRCDNYCDAKMWCNQ